MQHINVNNFQRKRQAVQLTWPVSDWRSDLLTSYTRYWAGGQTGAAATLIMFSADKIEQDKLLRHFKQENNAKTDEIKINSAAAVDWLTSEPVANIFIQSSSVRWPPRAVFKKEMKKD